MKTIYEYLNRDSSKIKINKKGSNRFWIRGVDEGVSIRLRAGIHDRFLIMYVDRDVDWRLTDSAYIGGGEVAYVCTNSERAATLEYSGSFDIGGEILGLTRKEYNPTDDIKEKEFQGAFADSDVIDCRELIITSNKIGDYGMAHMFDSCQKIIYSPKLPSTKLGKCCYMCMFEESNVEHACSELPATTLAEECYGDMYYSCWKLTDTPKSLPAIRLAKRCYAGMFGDCEKLKKINFSDLPAKKMEDECYFWMFNNSGIVDTPKIHAEVLAKGCFDGMFEGCYNIKDITFTSPKMSCSLATYGDYFDSWGESDMAENVTLTISKNANIPIPSTWTVKQI